MASASSRNRYVKYNLFGPPSSRYNSRPYEHRGTSFFAEVVSCISPQPLECLTPYFLREVTNAFSMAGIRSKQETGNALHCGYNRLSDYAIAAPRVSAYDNVVAGILQSYQIKQDIE
jgi:hypothetical protein